MKENKLDEMDKLFYKTVSAASFIGGGIVNSVVIDTYSNITFSKIQYAKHFVKGGLVGNAIFAGGVLIFKGYGKIFEKLGL